MLPRFKVEDELFLPRPAHDGDAGSDLRLYLPQTGSLMVNSRMLDKLVMDEQDANEIASNYEFVIVEGELVKENRLAVVREMVEKRSTVIWPNTISKLPTGFAVDLAPLRRSDTVPGMFILPRGGLSSYLSITNSPGLVDSGYRDMVWVKARNTSEYPIVLSHGQRFAQMVILTCFDMSTFTNKQLLATDLSDSTRGVGGDNSTGVA